jgi:hypothetical protein
MHASLACERRPALPGLPACIGAARPRPAQPPRRARSASPVSAGLHARPTRTAPTSRAASGAPPTRFRFRIRAPTSAPRPGSPLRHLHRDWASSHIYTSVPGLGSPIFLSTGNAHARGVGPNVVVGHHVSCLCAMQLRHLARRIAAVFYAGRKQVREEWVLHRRPAVTGRPQPAVRPPLGLVNTDALPAYARLRTGASHQCGPALQCCSEHQRSPLSRALTSSFTGSAAVAPRANHAVRGDVPWLPRARRVQRTVEIAEKMQPLQHARTTLAQNHWRNGYPGGARGTRSAKIGGRCFEVDCRGWPVQGCTALAHVTRKPNLRRP